MQQSYIRSKTKPIQIVSDKFDSQNHDGEKTHVKREKAQFQNFSEAFDQVIIQIENNKTKFYRELEEAEKQSYDQELPFFRRLSEA